MKEIESQTHSALEDRALLVWEIYSGLKERLGEQTAIELLEAAHLNFGRRVAKKYQITSASSSAVLAGFVQAQKAPFVVDVEKRGGATTVCFKECPYLRAWQAAGIGDHDISNLCKVASHTDKGILGSSGVSPSITTWRPGASECCRITAPS